MAAPFNPFCTFFFIAHLIGLFIPFATHSAGLLLDSFDEQGWIARRVQKMKKKMKKKDEETDEETDEKIRVVAAVRGKNVRQCRVKEVLARDYDDVPVFAWFETLTLPALPTLPMLFKMRSSTSDCSLGSFPTIAGAITSFTIATAASPLS